VALAQADKSSERRILRQNDLWIQAFVCARHLFGSGVFPDRNQSSIQRSNGGNHDSE
jgi:hypothetical protein